MLKKNAGFGTKAIHGGNQKDTQYGSLTMPIYQSSTFYFDDCQQGGDRFAGKEDGYIYTRLGNPTSNVLEDKVAILENSEAAAAFSSGMGAIASVFWTAAKAGSHIVADKTLYGCTYALLAHGLSRYGVEVSFVDSSNAGEVKNALRPETVAVYLETPANPTLKIADLNVIADLAHKYNPEIKVICDNTFATPCLQKPIDLGCDVVVHSATKYINGHGDVIAGIACGSAEFIGEVKMLGRKDMTGSVLGPFEAFLILRGLKTIELRMERHCENARRIAGFLAGHPKIEKVYYPGFESHPNHEVAKKQMSDFGGMVSCIVAGGRAAGAKLLNHMELCALAVSLGDAETLLEHPASMTHSTYTPEELRTADIPEGLVRISAGLENAEDIIEDFENSLKTI